MNQEPGEVALVDEQWLALYDHLSAIRKSLAFLVAVTWLGIILGLLAVILTIAAA